MLGVATQFLLPDMALSLTAHPLILCSVVIVSLGMGAFALHHHLMRRLMAFNVLGSGVLDARRHGGYVTQRPGAHHGGVAHRLAGVAIGGFYSFAS